LKGNPVIDQGSLRKVTTSSTGSGKKKKNTETDVARGLSVLARMSTNKTNIDFNEEKEDSDLGHVAACLKEKKGIVKNSAYLMQGSD